MHSSPFLRCVQTAVAISAGVDHWIGRMDVEAKHGNAKHHTLHSGSPHLHALDTRHTTLLSDIPEPEELTSRRTQAPMSKSKRGNKSSRDLLRLDPFLGEWLSPDYFENITPPPGSKMMVAGAKAELLRHGDPVEALNYHDDVSTIQGNFPGGWANNHPFSDDPPGPGDTDSTIPKDIERVPKLARAMTQSAVSAGKRGHFHFSSWMDHDHVAGSTGYLPPTPIHTVLPTASIPQGYVAHARDRCIKVDYQWDSMRPPLEWGSGGEYGEEWSSMHRRFRKGLHDMVAWYRYHEVAQEPDDSIDTTDQLYHTNSQPSEAPTDDEEDTILVLVTHGAGCNAMIGALTNQPVLIDVGLASLTMALCKKDVSVHSFDSSYPPITSTNNRLSIDRATFNDYDVKLIASTDHLRPGSQFLGGSPARSRSPSLPVREKSPYRYERHVGSPSRRSFNRSPVRNTSSREPQRTTAGSFEEDRSSGVKRANTTHGSMGGLWSRPVSNPVDLKSRTSAKRGETASVGTPVSNGADTPVGEKLESPSAPPNTTPNGTSVKVTAQPGLWKANSNVVGASRDQTTPKRRWTLGQA